MKQKFSKNQKVKIIANNNKHYFPNGEIVRVIGYYDGFYKCEYINKSDWWWVSPSDISLVKPNTAHLRTTRNNGFRFNLVAANGEIVATSEVYTNKAAAKKTLKNLFPEWEVVDQTKKKK